MSAPIKTCQYCGHKGRMPTFMDGETMCHSCLERLPTDAVSCRRRIVELEKKAKADKLALIDEILGALEEAPIPSSVFISDVCAGVIEIKQRIEAE